MDILSIVYIVILALALIMGFAKGFFKSIYVLIAGVVSVVGAAFAAKPIAGYVYTFDFATNAVAKTTNFFAAKGELFTNAYTETSFSTWASQFHVPSFLTDIINKIASFLIVDGENPTFAEVLGKSVVYYGIMVVAFIAVFVLAFIILRLIGNAFKSIGENSEMAKALDRLLGGVVFLAVGFVIVAGINYGLTFLVSKGGSVADWLTAQMKLGEDTFTLSKFFYEKNFLAMIISWIQKLLMK